MRTLILISSVLAVASSIVMEAGCGSADVAVIRNDADAQADSSKTATCAAVPVIQFGSLPNLSQSQIDTSATDCTNVGVACTALLDYDDAGLSQQGIPYGACSNAGTICGTSIPIYLACGAGHPGNGLLCNESGIQCTCAAGQWQCGVGAAGGGLCGCLPLEAGAD